MSRWGRILFAMLALAAAGFVHAQQWPTKPVRIISVFPPGGSVDQVARILAAQLQAQLGQTFIVENRGGASGSIGTQAVASAPPDGYTFGVVFDTHAVNPLLLKLPFDTLKDLSNVMLLGTSPMAIVANAKEPYKDFREVIAAAKQGKALSIGSIGTGSLGHLAVAQIDKSLGIDLVHVPYRGGGPLMTDAVGDQVPLAIGSVFLVTPHVKAGKLRALAVTSLKPTPQLPGALPVAEQGVPGFSALSWWGVIAPANTPRAILDKMYAELSKAIKDPGVAQKLADQGIDINGGAAAEMDQFVRGEMAKWEKVVKENGIKAGD